MQQVENKAKKDNTISVAKEIGSFGISLIPFLGDGKDLQESISGLDLITGKKLSALERVLAGACVIVPVVSGSMVRIAGKNAGIAEKMSLLSEKQLFKKAGKGIAMCEDAKKEMEQLIQGIRTMLEEDADIKRLFIRKTGAGPQVEIAGVGKVSLEEAEKLVGKDIRWSGSIGSVKSDGKTISQADRIKIDAWDYKPDDGLYLKYKGVFDNPKYYNQDTGNINWPENDGFESMPIDEVLQPGTRIDRYGSDFGSFTSPEGIPYKMRSVAPGTDLKPYSVFEVVKPINVKAGEIAPWFDEPGGGIQYLLPDTVDELLDAGVLRRIK